MAKKPSTESQLLLLLVATMFAMPLVAQSFDKAQTADEVAVRAVLARFYEGWNSHDVEKMVSVYAEDVDHINTRARWNQGKPAIREALRIFHAGPGKGDQKTYTIEKFRFLKPDVAVVQVRSLSTVGNIGTYVLNKQHGEWLVVSFTNVEYKLESQ